MNSRTYESYEENTGWHMNWPISVNLMLDSGLDALRSLMYKQHQLALIKPGPLQRMSEP